MQPGVERASSAIVRMPEWGVVAAEVATRGMDFTIPAAGEPVTQIPLRQPRPESVPGRERAGFVDGPCGAARVTPRGTVRGEEEVARADDAGERREHLVRAR